jgi:hypothetical protein
VLPVTPAVQLQGVWPVDRYVDSGRKKKTNGRLRRKSAGIGDWVEKVLYHVRI